jgi:hypothetical protein
MFLAIIQHCGTIAIVVADEKRIIDPRAVSTRALL